jgi:mediator of RNA polymerase II transcription subunit 18
MSNHAYEVALYGEFFARDLRAILNRITLHCESSHQMHTREVVFEPMHAGRDFPSEQGILRARKELICVPGEKEGW